MSTEISKPTRERLLDAIRDNPGITRAKLISTTGLPSGAVDPARIRLWVAGLIEPDSEAGWKRALANRVKTVGWQVVDEDRRGEVRARAAGRKERNAKPSAEMRAQVVVEALRDPTVSRLVRELTKDGGGSRRAQKRADATLRADHLARKRAAKEAARDRAANADFQKMLVQLWDARGAVGAVDKHLIEERARVAREAPRQISDADWGTALRDIQHIMTSFGAMWQNIRDLGEPGEPCPACGAPGLNEDRQLGAFSLGDVVDGEAEEIVDAEVVDS